MSCPSKQTRLEKMAMFCSTGKLHCSPSREERPVRPKSRRATTGSLLNSPVEESAPEVSGTIINVLSIFFFLICYLGIFQCMSFLSSVILVKNWTFVALYNCRLHYANSLVLRDSSLYRFLCWPFDPKWWPVSNFSLQYHPWITHWCHENKGNDHKLRKLSIVQQIFLFRTLGNVERTVRIICMLMWWCNRVKQFQFLLFP